MLKNTLLVALIATLPALAQDAAPLSPSTPARQAQHWGARGQMPNRPTGDMHKRMLDKFDADKDGQLNETERDAMKAEMEKRRAERGARPERPEGFRPGMRGEGFEGAKAGNRRRPHSERPEMINKFDTDKDGQLSEEERDALHDKVKAQRETRRENFKKEFMERFDTNKDAALSKEELEAAKAARGEGRRKKDANHRRPHRPFGPRPEGKPGDIQPAVVPAPQQ